MKADKEADKASTPVLTVEVPSLLPEGQFVAAMVTAPNLRHANIHRLVSTRIVTNHETTINDHVAVLDDILERIEAGSEGMATRLLASQALSLDAIATDLMTRAASSADLNTYERFMRLGLKAQSNSRATVEALVKLTRGGEQVVRHVHVHEGGQAVVADTFTHVAAGGQGGGLIGNDGQCHAATSACASSALPRPNPAQNGVPVPGNAERPLSYARRQ